MEGWRGVFAEARYMSGTACEPRAHAGLAGRMDQLDGRRNLRQLGRTRWNLLLTSASTSSALFMALLRHLPTGRRQLAFERREC